MSDTTPLVIYHGNCIDGFTAAWIAKKAMPDAELIPGKYGDPFPDDTTFAGRDVFILDFSYPRHMMSLIDACARSLLVLDHHKTAQEACEGLDFCKFDMEQSGAGMAWRHFFPDKPMPMWIQCVEDRDLWNWKLDDTAEIHAFLASLDQTIENWTSVSKAKYQDMFFEGSVILCVLRQQQEAALEDAFICEIGGHTVGAVNCRYEITSDTLNAMLRRFKNHEILPTLDYAIGFYLGGDGTWRYSVRSLPEFDCSEIAKKFDGGGHAQAAGFRLSYLLKELHE